MTANERWPALMDRALAAEYLSISIGTIDRLIAGGELKPVLVRGLPRYKRHDLDEYIETLPSGATAKSIASRTPGLKKRRAGKQPDGSAATAELVGHD